MKRSRRKTSKTQPAILVFNVGSSSVKAALYSGEREDFRIAIDRVTSPERRAKAVRTVARAVDLAGYKLTAVAHRIVHGGSLTKHCVITPAVMRKLRHVAILAPLHDIPELEVVDFCRKQFRCAQIAVFDTAFHATNPAYATTYGIPLAEFKQGVRKYGFHGISHAFVTKGLRGRVISCHLGSGCSITAIKDGESLENSMGFTPLDGVVMGTRSGTIDPGVLVHFAEHDKLSFKKIKHMLNHESGWLGISGISSDMRDLLATRRRNKRSQLAIDVFVHSVVRLIGSYVAILGGVDTIVFTGGIGQNSEPVRKMICDRLSAFSVKLDARANAKNARLISTAASKVRIQVVPTNEELAMVRIATKLRR